MKNNNYHHLLAEIKEYILKKKDKEHDLNLLRELREIVGKALVMNTAKLGSIPSIAESDPCHRVSPGNKQVWQNK